VLKQLGDGTYGNVWKAINRQTSEVVSLSGQEAAAAAAAAAGCLGQHACAARRMQQLRAHSFCAVRRLQPLRRAWSGTSYAAALAVIKAEVDVCHALTTEPCLLTPPPPPGRHQEDEAQVLQLGRVHEPAGGGLGGAWKWTFGSIELVTDSCSRTDSAGW
jgi:hypothetical protein